MGPYWPKLGGLCVLFNSSPTSPYNFVCQLSLIIFIQHFKKKYYVTSYYRFNGFNMFQVLKLLFCLLVKAIIMTHKIYCKKSCGYNTFYKSNAFFFFFEVNIFRKMFFFLVFVLQIKYRQTCKIFLVYHKIPYKNL